MRAVAAYLTFALVFGGGLSVLISRQNSDRREARRQSCAAMVDQRRTLADVIALAVPPVRPVDTSLSPELQRLIRENQERTQSFLDRTQTRLARPIPFCTQAGINTTVTVHGAKALPVQVTSTPGTTTSTTRSAVHGSSAPRTRPRGAARTPSTRPAASGSAPTTTTRPSPRTTTTRCRVQVPTDGCVVR